MRKLSSVQLANCALHGHAPGPPARPLMGRRLTGVVLGGERVTGGMFIAVEGPTGVGKTTLAAHLAAALDGKAAFDPFELNPFLPQLLAAGETAGAELALRVELTFFALRVAQLRRIKAILASGTSVVTDWALIKQPIFAATTLSPEDSTRVTMTCQLWAEGLPAPDLLIGLSASTAVLRARVRQRGREMECALNDGQLAALSAAFDHAYARWSRPLILLDAATFDAFDARDLTELVAEARQLLTSLESR
ncbi:MAG: deoxynucleoside kinase [Streptomycetales bacterium]